MFVSERRAAERQELAEQAQVDGNHATEVEVEESCKLNLPDDRSRVAKLMSPSKKHGRTQRTASRRARPTPLPKSGSGKHVAK